MARENSLDPPYSPNSKREKGRPRHIEREELEGRAQSLIIWMEDNWPEISRGLNIAQSEQQVAEVFNRKWRGNYISDAPFFSEPGRFAGDCLKFIRGKKYRGNPRNLAAAMAGLPEISARTSFNRCAAFAAKCHPVGFRAYRDYLRRKFHDRFRKLIAASTTEEVEEILGGSRSKDAVLLYLIENAAKVLYWLECGIPGNSHMYDQPEFVINKFGNEP